MSTEATDPIVQVINGDEQNVGAIRVQRNGVRYE